MPNFQTSPEQRNIVGPEVSELARDRLGVVYDAVEFLVRAGESAGVPPEHTYSPNDIMATTTPVFESGSNHTGDIEAAPVTPNTLQQPPITHAGTSVEDAFLNGAYEAVDVALTDSVAANPVENQFWK